MIKIKYSIRPYIKGSTGQVAIRVRWNQSKYDTAFFTPVWAERSKWDSDKQRAKKTTIHSVRGNICTHFEINSTIAEYIEKIDAIFTQCSLANSIPSIEELKNMVDKALGRRNMPSSLVETKVNKLTFNEITQHFLDDQGREKNWDYQAKAKYIQAFQQMTKANPGITPDKIIIDHMFALRDWYVNNGYCNRTINKQVTMLKSFLKWLNMQDGYTVPARVLEFKTNLKVIPKTVTFMHYEELFHFAHFQFEDGNERLTRARDLWCFMAFTSLRISDLQRLRKIHIQEGYIKMYAKKTSERLTIPLTQEPLAILERYLPGKKDDDLVFDVQSPQKLNDAVKDAAKAAGIDRVITEADFFGTERRETTSRFCDIISNHDARRTFVTCSLAMGIAPETVMKCTGHSSYTTMKPYIETTTETVGLEMEKWNSNQYHSQIISHLKDKDENFLKDVLGYIQQKETDNTQQAS